MKVLVSPRKQPGQELELFREWPGAAAPSIRKQALVISLLVHGVAIAALLLLPEGTLIRQSTGRGFQAGPILVAPPNELTQTAPNRGKVAKEFSLENLVPHRALVIPPALPPVSRTQSLPVALPEPPSVDTARTQAPSAPPPPLGSAALPAPPPPQIQAEENPFETPGVPSGKPRAVGPPVAVPSTSVTEATRQAMHSPSGSVAVADRDLPGSSGTFGGLIQRPTPGKVATQLEMTSDPMGVDFKPYLIRILAAVKRNWLAVVPESARLGRIGRVQIQFAIDRDGSVPKLVIAMPSGTDALDRAAVAGVSASSPFPPLPAEFKGNQVRLQFTFSYNIK
jgi:TonB family protein